MKYEEDLVDKLFEGYNKKVIPQYNVSVPLVVTMELSLFSIINLVSNPNSNKLC